MQYNDGGVLTLAPHGENPWEDLGSDPGGGNRGRGEGDLCGVLPPRPDFSDISSGGLTGEDSRTGQTMGELHV